MFQRMKQLVKINGFCYVVIHSAGQCLCHILGKGIGSQGNNGDGSGLWVAACPDHAAAVQPSITGICRSMRLPHMYLVLRK